MENIEIYIVSLFGGLTLVGVFWKMKPGIGVFNLRAIGIVLIATFAGVLASKSTEALMAAIGIFGAIAGYLFGAEEKSSGSSSVDMKNNKLGDNTKIAGRDINETIEKLEGSISNIQEAVVNQTQYLSQFKPSNINRSFLINTIYERGHERLEEALDSTIAQRQSQGWFFAGLSSDYQGMDGIFLIFERDATKKIKPGVTYHHGSI